MDHTEVGGSVRAVDETLAIDGGRPVRTATLPLSRPWVGDAEVRAAADAISQGLLTGNGPLGAAFERRLASRLGVPHVLFVTSCSAALEMAVQAAGIGPGHEVICPSFTFVSCANAILRRGARPVFADINASTLNIDPAAIARAVTPRSRAVLVVHYAGRACDMAAILDLARQHRLAVIEDAAHGLGATWNGRALGTIGEFGCFSFHGTKDLVCGEGGALLVRDARAAATLELIREKGTNRAAFLRGQVDKYTWVEEGGSYVASDVLAAVINAQLDRLDEVLKRKRAHAARLTRALEPLEPYIELPREWAGIESSWHIYPILVPPAAWEWMIRALNAEGMGAAFHYVPLHSSPVGRERLGYRPGDLPVTERISRSLIRLPLFATMTEDEVDQVAAAVNKVVGGARRKWAN